MTLVLIGKALLLEASKFPTKGSLGENYMSLAEIRRFKSTDTRICFGHGIYGIFSARF